MEVMSSLEEILIIDKEKGENPQLGCDRPCILEGREDSQW